MVGIVTVVAVRAAVVGIVTAGAATQLAAVMVATTVTAGTTAVVTSPVVAWSRSKTSLSPASTTDRNQRLDERFGLRRDLNR